MRENPQQLITRYNFCGLFRDVYHSVLTMSNIISGFKSTGIYPFNPQAITAEHMQFSAVDTELEFQDEDQEPAEEPVIIPVVFDGDVNIATADPLFPTGERANTPPTDASSAVEPMDIETQPEDGEQQIMLEELPHSSTQAPRFAALLKKPVMKKIVKKGTSKRVTEARCLTADEIYTAEVEKHQKKERELAEKEARKVEREKKRNQKEKEKQEKQVLKLLKQKEKQGKYK